jgi:hypothetical protein
MANFAYHDSACTAERLPDIPILKMADAAATAATTS